MKYYIYTVYIKHIILSDGTLNLTQWFILTTTYVLIIKHKINLLHKYNRAVS